MRTVFTSVGLLLLLACSGAEPFDPVSPTLTLSNSPCTSQSPCSVTADILDVFSSVRRDAVTGASIGLIPCEAFEGEFTIEQVADTITMDFQAWHEDRQALPPNPPPVFATQMNGAIVKDNVNTGALEFVVSTTTPGPCLFLATDQCSSIFIIRNSPFCCHDWGLPNSVFPELIFMDFTGEFGSFVTQGGTNVEFRGLLTRRFRDGTECRTTINFP